MYVNKSQTSCVELACFDHVPHLASAGDLHPVQGVHLIEPTAAVVK